MGIVLQYIVPAALAALFGIIGFLVRSWISNLQSKVDEIDRRLREIEREVGESSVAISSLTRNLEETKDLLKRILDVQFFHREGRK